MISSVRINKSLKNLIRQKWDSQHISKEITANYLLPKTLRELLIPFGPHWGHVQSNMELFGKTVQPNKILFGGTVPPNSFPLECQSKHHCVSVVGLVFPNLEFFIH